MVDAENKTSLVFELKPIQAISPSLAEVLRNCPLQAAFSRISRLKKSVLDNPKAWLGTAYHDVLEKLWNSTKEELTDMELVEYLWKNAIDTLCQQAIIHPLNRRFATPEKWPGYHLVRACVRVRAEEYLAEQPRLRTTAGTVSNSTGVLREQRLIAMDGKLVGKPDVVMDNEIRDYKSGRIYNTTTDGTQAVKQKYVRQLHLYGHLVYENCGYCPSKGILIPMQGPSIEINLDPETCAAEAAEAIKLLDSFNAKLAMPEEVSSITTPSPKTCRWCQYKALCPAFWNGVEDSWGEELGSASVRGVLKESPALIHNGRAFSLSLEVSSGTTASSEVSIAPLDGEIHSQLAAFQTSDAVRIVNLYQRRSGQLAPTPATLCFLDIDCPLFKFSNTVS